MAKDSIAKPHPFPGCDGSAHKYSPFYCELVLTLFPQGLSGPVMVSRLDIQQGGTWLDQLAIHSRLVRSVLVLDPSSSTSSAYAFHHGALEPTTRDVCPSWPYTIPKWDSSTPCLVADLSHLNRFADPIWFQMLILALHPGTWFMALDLENAYWHITTAPRCHCFLAIQLGPTVLQFTEFPFHLNITPQVFTRMMNL